MYVKLRVTRVVSQAEEAMLQMHHHNLEEKITHVMSGVFSMVEWYFFSC